MPLSEQRKEYLYEYQKTKLKRIPLDVQKEKYEEISAAAESKGETVNGYIKKAIDERRNVTTEHPRNSSSLLTHTMDIHKPNILLSWEKMTLCRYLGNGFIPLMLFTLCRRENGQNSLTASLTGRLPSITKDNIYDEYNN